MDFPDILHTSGFVLCDIAWGSAIEKTTMTLDGEEFFDVFDRNGLIDYEKLAHWTESKTLDPEDPKNSILYDCIKSYTDNINGVDTDKKYFRLNPLLTDLTFCDTADIERNIRFILLNHRDNNVPEFAGMMVPNRLKEIPINVLQNYLQRLKHHRQDFDCADDNLEVRRSKGRNFLRQIYMEVFQKCRNTENNVCFEDVVDEKYLAHFDLFIEMLLQKLVNFFSFRPSVEKKLERTMAKNAIESGINGPVRIMVHLQSAINVLKTDGEDVRPYITFECAEKTVTSSTALGNNCTWNEEIVIVLE